MAKNLIHENIWLSRQIYENAESSYHELKSIDTADYEKSKIINILDEAESELIDIDGNKTLGIGNGEEDTSETKNAEGHSELNITTPSEFEHDVTNILEIEEVGESDINGSSESETKSISELGDVTELEKRIMETLSFEDLSLLEGCCTPSEHSLAMDYVEPRAERVSRILVEIKMRVDQISARSKIVEQKVKRLRNLILDRPKSYKKVRKERVVDKFHFLKPFLHTKEDIENVVITPSPTSVGIVTLDIIPTYNEEGSPNYEKFVRNMFITGVVWGRFEWVTIERNYRKFRIKCYLLENKVDVDLLKDKLKVLPSLDRIDVIDYYSVYPD